MKAGRNGWLLAIETTIEAFLVIRVKMSLVWPSILCLPSSLIEGFAEARIQIINIKHSSAHVVAKKWITSDAMSTPSMHLSSRH